MILRAATSPFVRRSMSVIFVASILAIVGGMYGLFDAQNKIARLSTLDSAADRYFYSLVDSETAYRGFVIVGSPDFLTPYQEAVKNLEGQEMALNVAAANAKVGDGEINNLTRQGPDLLAYAQKLIAARNASFTSAQQMVAARVGKNIMDAARANIAALHNITEQATVRHDNRIKKVYLPVIVLGFLGLLGSSIVFGLVIRKTREMSVRARAMLAHVMERAPIGLALLDARHNVHLMNATFSQMAGRQAKAAGRPLLETAPDIGKVVEQRISDAIKRDNTLTEDNADAIFDVETDGQLRSFKADIFPMLLQDDNGREQRGAGLVLTDITRQREWEQQLEEARDAAEGANRAKSAFIANMSHELRTPLTAVLGYCELIEDDVRDLGHEGILADLKKININARHLLGLINDVLDLSKIEAQRMDVHAIDVPLSKLMTEVEAATGSLVSRRENSFRLVLPAQELMLHTDDLKVKQILLNLISNSAKFTEKGEISLSISEAVKDGVAHTQFVVRDNGIGMTPDQVSNLFQRFTQADETTTRKYGGTGLGLALTRALAIMLGGTIDVESVQGKGTTFTVSIPTRYAAPAVDMPVDLLGTAAKPAAENGGAGTKDLVLVVDDELSARDVLTRHLTREGFDVVSATSGAEALELIKNRRPVAVLLDVLMPGMDGWHVLRSIRANPDTADLPVIMQTCVDDSNFAYAMGATAYLKKPVRRTELSQALSELPEHSSTHHVLVVDDDLQASSHLKTMLERDGWSVHLAASGDEGLAQVRQKIFDLVLVDLVMPGMDGYAFIRNVRANAEFDNLPIVVMTAQDVTSGKVRRLARETSGIVQKGSMPLSELVADLRKIAGTGKPPRSKSMAGAN